jgi:hypothetical protein
MLHRLQQGRVGRPRQETVSDPARSSFSCKRNVFAILACVCAQGNYGAQLNNARNMTFISLSFYAATTNTTKAALFIARISRKTTIPSTNQTVLKPNPPPLEHIFSQAHNWNL